jgi:hypothetical protein
MAAAISSPARQAPTPFVYVTGGGADIVTDFQPTPGRHDRSYRCRFSPLVCGSCDHSAGRQYFHNFGNGDSLTLAGTTAIDLGDSDFIFNPAAFVSLEWKNQIEPLAALAEVPAAGSFPTEMASLPQNFWGLALPTIQ